MSDSYSFQKANWHCPCCGNTSWPIEHRHDRIGATTLQCWGCGKHFRLLNTVTMFTVEVDRSEAVAGV